MEFRSVARAIAALLFYCTASAVVIYSIFFNASSPSSTAVALFCIIAMAVVSLVALVLTSNTTHLRARQVNETLDLAGQTVTFMREGLSNDSAQAVCELLMGAVSAAAVAITDRESILGFVGIDSENHAQNTPIKTEVTKLTLEDGETRVVDAANAIGFTGDSRKIKGAIIAPLKVRRQIVGTLKFYYTNVRRMDEAQQAMAEGFAELLSTQLSLSYLEQQTELATRMELRALQAQINPHFLFNTINTIASYTRTDPDKARKMLREFAVYYRRLLENSEDLIEVDSEIEQTERYLMFQRARFGEEAVTFAMSIEPGLEHLRVPAFIIQPIVENAVGHGRRETGETLHITVKVYRAGDSAIICVEDDGIGIKPDVLGHVVKGGSKTGMGIALKNVNARLKGYFGSLSGLHIESTYGKGTTVYLSMYDAFAGEEAPAADADEPETDTGDAE